MKKRWMLSLLSILCCLSVASCGTNQKGNEGKDPLTGQKIEENTSSEENEESTATNVDEIDQFIEDAKDTGEITAYIAKHLAEVTTDEIQKLFQGLFRTGDDLRTIDYSAFDESKQYLPEDMIAYMELMKLETESPSMVMSSAENKKIVGLTLSELLERAVLFEKHLDKYPDGISTDPASRIYEEIATYAITGGYDKENSVENYYKGESPDEVDRESVKYYEQFAQANEDTRIGMIVKEYIVVLQENDFKINENVENFYRGLYQKLFPEQS